MMSKPATEEECSRVLMAAIGYRCKFVTALDMDEHVLVDPRAGFVYGHPHTLRGLVERLEAQGLVDPQITVAAQREATIRAACESEGG